MIRTRACVAQEGVWLPACWAAKFRQPSTLLREALRFVRIMLRSRRCVRPKLGCKPESQTVRHLSTSFDTRYLHMYTKVTFGTRMPLSMRRTLFTRLTLMDQLDCDLLGSPRPAQNRSMTCKTRPFLDMNHSLQWDPFHGTLAMTI
jgi:hypothetical protein